MTIDCHIHSDFSFDGRMTPNEACQAALHSNARLEGIAFVDHLDLDYPGYEDIIIDYNKYTSTMKAFQNDLKGNLAIIIGSEVGIQPDTLSKTCEIIGSLELDYILGSVHIIDHMDPGVEGYYDGKTSKECYSRYLQELVFLIRNFEYFDIMGHFDYIIRYAPYKDRSIKYRNHADIFDQIFRDLINRGKGFEINTGSYRDQIGRPAPEFDIDILRRYKELGGELICLGSDSHKPEYIGYKFDFFKEIIKKAGINQLVHFIKHRPVFEQI